MQQSFHNCVQFSTGSSNLHASCVPVKASLNRKGINLTWYLCEKQWNRYSLGESILMPTSSHRYKSIRLYYYYYITNNNKVINIVVLIFYVVHTLYVSKISIFSKKFTSWYNMHNTYNIYYMFRHQGAIFRELL